MVKSITKLNRINPAGLNLDFRCLKSKMRYLLIFVVAAQLTACTTTSFELKNLAKSKIDMVADEFIAESRRLVLELMVKLYKRNPRELAKVSGIPIDGRLKLLKERRAQLLFKELGNRQGIDALELVFRPKFRGDRVFALIVGLGGMLRQAYGYREEMFMLDRLNDAALLASSHNVEVLAWRLKNDRNDNNSHYLVTSEYKGVVDNLSFERLFGKLIALQEMMARIVDGAGARAANTAVRAVSMVFVPLPM